MEPGGRDAQNHVRATVDDEGAADHRPIGAEAADPVVVTEDHFEGSGRSVRIEREGLTLVPLELYFKNGVAKVALALAKGKKLHDKRDTERTRDAEREMARVARSR